MQPEATGYPKNEPQKAKKTRSIRPLALQVKQNAGNKRVISILTVQRHGLEIQRIAGSRSHATELVLLRQRAGARSRTGKISRRGFDHEGGVRLPPSKPAEWIRAAFQLARSAALDPSLSPGERLRSR
jgi:hypothetical protein